MREYIVRRVEAPMLEVRVEELLNNIQPDGFQVHYIGGDWATVLLVMWNEVNNKGLGSRVLAEAIPWVDEKGGKSNED